ncbi:MAG: phosphatase [Clostridia bacterium]|nr:phosphatase [Clostridia bacterium]
MICGVVDIGSNTIRLSVYRCENGENKLLMHRKTMAGLASYVKDGLLPDEGVRIICTVLTEYRILLDNLEIPCMYVFATAPLRNISNTEEAVSAVYEETKIKINVLSGEEEAVLSFAGASLGTKYKKGVMVDLGGGSTEILRYENDKILTARSMPIGSLNLFNRYVKAILPTEDERKTLQKAVRDQIERASDDLLPTPHILGVGGTIRAVSSVLNHLFSRSDDCKIISAEEIRMLLKRMEKPDGDILHELLKIVPDRIHTIVPGLTVLEAVTRTLDAEDITVSRCGVREGYLVKSVLKS